MEDEVNWDDCLQYATVSDIGMRRATNQDSFAVVLASDMDAWRRSGHLFVVADGMGAHAAGELASDMAVSGITHRYHKYHHLSPPEALHKSIQETNAEVHGRGQANLDFHNMGTTVSALTLLPQGALVGHVGDSRVYRQRGRRLEQLTFDHSLVWELRASGQFDGNEEFANSVPKNIITRSLGPNATVQADFEGPFPLEEGDTFLLCSDGLTGLVTDDEIGPILASLPPQKAAQVLTDLANLRGGHDNITVIVVQVINAAMTTRVAGAQPLTIHRDRARSRANPALWIVASVCVLAAMAMAVLSQYTLALIALAVGLVTAAGAMVRRWVLMPHSIALGATRRFGKGPYVTVNCPVNAEFTNRLAALVDQLRSATEGEQWDVNLQQFDVHCQAARQAVQTGQHETAQQNYLQAISFMMNELRHQAHRGHGPAPPEALGH